MSSTSFSILNLLFPVVLAIHNVDEYAGGDAFLRVYPAWLARTFITRRLLRDAAISLTLAAAMLGFSTFLYPTTFLLTCSKVAMFALMFNAIGHCGLSLRRRALMPGSRSAIALVLPYSFAAIVAMRSSLGDSFDDMLCFAAWGMVALPLVTALFLGIGYGLSRLATWFRR